MEQKKILPVNKIICGDCEEVLKSFPDSSVDLIITSPPYADSRKRNYGGISPQKYPEWFFHKRVEFLRVLKPSGTFILNIKEKVVNAERHTYVLEIILGMKKQGWLWTEEFIWHKKNCYPGKWPNRFRDAWERCLQFNKNKKFHMYQENVMLPVGNWSKTRLKRLSEMDQKRFESRSKSGFGKNISNWIDREMVYPTNVLHLATECSFKNQSAPFPLELPEWFIRLFTKEGDIVLDPFLGSGTAAVAAARLGRNYIGIDTIEEYCEISRGKLINIQDTIFKVSSGTISYE